MALVLGAGCRSGPGVEPPLDRRIANAHDIVEWNRYRALRGDVHVHFEGSAAFDATFTYDIATGRVRMQTADDSILVFDGRQAWVSPANAATQRARYHLLTWPFFITAPFRLSQPGASLGPASMRPLGQQDLLSANLTFAPGGAAPPHDWYVLYVEPSTGLLRGIAYRATYGGSASPAAPQPQAVTFYSYENVEGVRIPGEWRFWKWNETVGIYDKPIGVGRVYNLQFIAPRADAFQRPPDARPDSAPPAP